VAGGGIDFTFDPAPFLAGMRKASDGMSGLLGKAADVEKRIAGGINRAVTGVAAKVGLLFAAFKSVGAALREMPEVGMAFGIAKDVFLKNLLWPLRQQVMPMLQAMLDWTRDNRAQFVKWGTVLANVFGAVTVTAKVLWGVFKELTAAVGDSFQRAFHTSFKTFDEFLNVLSFKVSAVIIYMGMLAKELVGDLKPAFDWILDMGATVVGFFVDLVTSWAQANEQGKSLGTVFEKIGAAVSVIAGALAAAAKGFTEGLLPAVSGIMTPLDGMAATFNRLLGVLGLDDTKGIRGAFKGLGTFLGTTFHAALVVIGAAFDGMVTALENIKRTMEAIQSLFKGDVTGAGAAMGEVLKSTSRGGTKSVEEAYDIFTGEVLTPGPTGLRSGGSLHDGIVTKDGRVIKTDPQDNIYAFKSLGSARHAGGQVQVTNYVTVSVTEGDAERAGYEFASGLARGYNGLSGSLAESRMAEGF
jgi:hypothetical protein